MTLRFASTPLRHIAAIALTTTLGLGFMSPLAAQKDAPTAEIRIGDADGAGAKEKVEDPWIGIGAGLVSDAVRANVDIPGNSGLMVELVIPDGPAHDAGLRKYDILIRADKNPLREPADLVDIVNSWDGTTDGIKIEWMRKGKEMSEIITPAERPDNGPGIGFNPQANPLGQLGQVQGMNGGMRFRILGPGVQGASSSVQSMSENGLSIKIQRSNDEPAKISVDDGESNWEITEDDLDELPDDIAKRVKKMLKNQSQVRIQPFGGQIPNIQIPNMPNMPNLQPMPDFKQMQKEMEKLGIPRMEQRFEDMEKQMQKMLEEIERLQPPAIPAAEPAGEDA